MVVGAAASSAVSAGSVDSIGVWLADDRSGDVVGDAGAILPPNPPLALKEMLIPRPPSPGASK